MTIEAIGRHAVRRGDLMDPGAIAELMGGARAGIIYGDPPWGEGNIKFWATKLAKDTGEQIQPSSLEVFLATWFGAARDFCDGYLLCEYGIRWDGVVQDHAAAAGFEPHGIVELLYKGGGKTLPLHLHLFARPGLAYPAGYAEALHHTMGYQTVRTAVEPLAALLPGCVVLDPCCGMGYTAQAAVDFGLTFRGNELNPVRLEKTKNRLRKSL